jgi:tetratricopeptide (TPR) repeat protein
VGLPFPCDNARIVNQIISTLVVFVFSAGCTSMRETRSLLPAVSAPRETLKDFQTDSALKALLQQGHDRYKRADFAGATALWESAWILNSGKTPDPWIQVLLYYCYLTTGQYKKAAALAEERVKTEPHSPLGYHQLGVAQLWQGKPAESETTLRLAAEFDSRAPDTFFYLGIAISRQNKPAEAAEQWDKGAAEYATILRSNPSDFSANYGLAQLQIYRDSVTPDTLKLIGAARESVQSLSETESPIEREFFQDFYLPLLEGAYALKTENPKAALAHLFHALQHTASGAMADFAEVCFFLSLGFKQLGQREIAEDFLTRSQDLDPFGPYSRKLSKKR